MSTLIRATLFFTLVISLLSCNATNDSIDIDQYLKEIAYSQEYAAFNMVSKEKLDFIILNQVDVMKIIEKMDELSLDKGLSSYPFDIFSDIEGGPEYHRLSVQEDFAFNKLCARYPEYKKLKRENVIKVIHYHRQKSGPTHNVEEVEEILEHAKRY